MKRTPRSILFFFNDTATAEIYTLSLHDALPISRPSSPRSASIRLLLTRPSVEYSVVVNSPSSTESRTRWRSEEHTSELQSRQYLVCRLLLEKKNISAPSVG